MNSLDVIVNAPVSVRRSPQKCFQTLSQMTALQVEWEEASCSFTGVVKSVNADGSCDVLYDEQVGGKPCLEKNVEASRLHLAAVAHHTNECEDEDHWHDSGEDSARSLRKRGKRKASRSAEVEYDDGVAEDANNLATRLLQVRPSKKRNR
jgi:hypothetical protein